MSVMHPKATDTSLRTSCRDGPLSDLRLKLLKAPSELNVGNGLVRSQPHSFIPRKASA